MTMTTSQSRAKALALKTADAYMAESYGTREWLASARLLVDRCYSDAEVEEILRSKLMRWADDGFGYGGKHGRPCAKALADFLDHKHGRAALKGLWAETQRG